MINRIDGIDLKVGVAMMDRDHQEMFECFQELRDGIVRGKERSHTETLLRKLAHFTRTHFALEYDIMSATKYPGNALHRLEHQWLVEQMDTLVALCNQSDFILKEQSVAFLNESHLAHIQQDDRHYSFWLNGRAIQ